MQNFDTLRHRVEETAERLSSAQSERQQETQSLIGILRDLEEKYSTQEKQFAYYQDRVAPLERSNAQLTALIEKLLDLIDRGFGESSLESLRKASAMATTMLERDFSLGDGTSYGPNGKSHHDVVVTDDDAATAIADERPPMASLDDFENDDWQPGGEDAGETHFADDWSADDDLETVNGAEDEAQIIQDLMDLVEENRALSFKDTSDVDDSSAEEQGESRFNGVADLELEEVPLSYLDDDIDAASDTVNTDFDAVAAASLAEPDAEDMDFDVSAVAEDETEPLADLLSDDDEAGANDWRDSLEALQRAQFEDVSEAVLKQELAEDARKGLNGLPEIVKTGIADFLSHDTAEEADTIAALALAMEKETNSGSTAPPATSDIRSLMLRVEALAKKAEAMRLAQNTDQNGEITADKGGNEPGGSGRKNSGVAA